MARCASDLNMRDLLTSWNSFVKSSLAAADNYEFN